MHSNGMLCYATLCATLLSYDFLSFPCSNSLILCTESLIGDGNEIWKVKHKCNFPIKTADGKKNCGLVFENANQLKVRK